MAAVASVAATAAEAQARVAHIKANLDGNTVSRIAGHHGVKLVQVLQQGQALHHRVVVVVFASTAALARAMQDPSLDQPLTILSLTLADAQTKFPSFQLLQNTGGQFNDPNVAGIVIATHLPLTLFLGAAAEDKMQVFSVSALHVPEGAMNAATTPQ